METANGMFGKYQTKGRYGVNPPYDPAYPLEWGCDEIRQVEVIARVDPQEVARMFAMGKPATPFEMIGEKASIRFLWSKAHTMSLHQPYLFEMQVSVPVRYENYFALTHLHRYLSGTPRGMGLRAAHTGNHDAGEQDKAGGTGSTGRSANAL